MKSTLVYIPFLLGINLIFVPSQSSSQINVTTTDGMVESTTESATTVLTETIVDSTEETNQTFSNREEKQLHLNQLTCHCDVGNNNYMKLCPGGRHITDPNCKCRLVCARQNGQSCKEDEPCDEEFGLRCDPDTLICQGRLMVQRTETTHNSLSVRWRNSKDAAVSYALSYKGNETTWIKADAFDGTAKLVGLKPNKEYYVKVEGTQGREIALIKTKDGCTINETSHVGLGEIFYVGCDQTCTCMQNGKTECRERCNFRPGTISDPSCQELPDESDRCCVIYHCRDTPLPTTPKLLVTQRTPESLTLAWDDFKLPNYESGYVVQYRSKDDKNWTQVQAGNIPLKTITNLKPYTAYQIRVSIWEDEERKKLGPSSEIVTIFTEDKSYSDKHGECPKNYTTNNCTRDCRHDYECPGNDKCCPTSCGGTVCLEPWTLRNACGDIACGPNAFCIPDPQHPRCECEAGFAGNPNDLMKGCVETNMSNCSYKNLTYHVGEEFEDGCDKKCRCDHDLMVKCHPVICQSVDNKVEARHLTDYQMSVLTDNATITEKVTEHVMMTSTTEQPTMETMASMEKTTEHSMEKTTEPPIAVITTEQFKSTEKVTEHSRIMESMTEHSMIMGNDKENSLIVEKSTESPITANPEEHTMRMENEMMEHSTLGHTTEHLMITAEVTKPPMMSTTEQSTVEHSTEHPMMNELSTITTRTTEHTMLMDKITEHPMTNQITEHSTIVNNTEDTTTEHSTVSENTTQHVMVTEQISEQTTKMSELTTMDYPMLADQPRNLDSVPTATTTTLTHPTTTQHVTTDMTKEHSSTSGEMLSEKPPPLMKSPRLESNMTNLMHKDHPVRIKGCDYGGKIYQMGQQFYDGCEARCLCDGNGHISCLPRCPLVSTVGDKCREVVDPNDNCCRIVLCEPPGDTDTVEAVEDLKIKIDSIMAQNATSVRLRITVSNDTADRIYQVWYAVTSNESVDGVTWWTKMKLTRNQMKRVKNGTYEIIIHGLKSDTEYYFKVKDIGDDHDGFSNTVSAKTFIQAVKTAFKGCFHHNKTYESGQVFFDGCEYKCVCRENGQIECRERCDIYIDTVGFENCRWGPAPDDACCRIPFCDEMTEKPPTDNHTSSCVIAADRVYQVGDKWEEECTRKLCTCLLLPNGTAHVECSGGCAPIPSSAQHPSLECPQPVLVTPDDPCICPYIVCNNAVSPLNVPVPMCQHKGREYHLDEEFYDGCHAVCHCGRDLRVNCAVIECPQHFSSHVSECLEWDVDPTFVPTPPQCCPQSRCKNDGSCLMNGIRFSNFQPIPNQLLDCGTHCVCVHGNVTCENRCPHLSEIPPTNLPCPPALAFRGHLPGDDCCLHWMCRDQERQTQQCIYHGRSYRRGEQWEVRKGSLRRLCTCELASDGQPEVECAGGCPSIPDHYQYPTPQCPRPVLVRPEDPVMCPYVVCNNTVSAKELQNVSVVALNATSIRVRFTLPSLLVGLVGHAELHFTSDPTIPRTAWHIQKFARPKRLFDTPNIEYHMSGLRPDTLYFFQVQVVITALQGGPESDIYKLRMPPVTTTTLLTTPPTTTSTTTTTTTSSTTTTPEPTTTTTERTPPPTTTTSTTTTTTTTTTLPPMIMLDAMVSVQMLDPKTAKIEWRPFEPQEKKFIDGYRVKYKTKGSGDDQWKVSPMIHRDVTSYTLRDLEPSASYMVDLVFATPKEIPTHLVSTSPVEVRTPQEPKDNFDFQVLLRQDKVGPYSLEVSLSGVPEPVSKYVHVIRISYKSDSDGEHQHIFKVPKTQKIKLEGLKPGRRYKAWMDIYLTNGKTLSSNVIDFMTKAAPPESRSKQEVTKHEENSAEALHSSLNEDENKAYYIALIVVAIVAAVAGLGFIVLLIILLKKQSTAKAPITRNSSESAYDNPTYKTYDGERYEEKNSA